MLCRLFFKVGAGVCDVFSVCGFKRFSFVLFMMERPYCLFPGPTPFSPQALSPSLWLPLSRVSHSLHLFSQPSSLLLSCDTAHPTDSHTHTHTRKQPVLCFLCSFMYVCVNISLSFWETGSSTNICSIIWGTAAVIVQSSCRYSASSEFSGANIKCTVVTRQISQSWSQYFVMCMCWSSVFFLLPAHTNHHTSATFKWTVSTHFSHIHVEHICGYILKCIYETTFKTL